MTKRRTRTEIMSQVAHPHHYPLRVLHIAHITDFGPKEEHILEEMYDQGCSESEILEHRQTLIQRKKEGKKKKDAKKKKKSTKSGTKRRVRTEEVWSV